MFTIKSVWLYSTLIVLSGLLGSCGERLPKPSQKGTNTFGCRINGKNWVPDGGGGFSGIKPVSGGFFQISSYPVYKRGIYIRARSRDRQSVQLYLNDYRVGIYPLNKDTQSRPANLSPQDYSLYKSKDRQEYITSSQNTGTIVITHSDTLTGIVSGTFAFEAGLVTDPGQTVRITKGRFDVNTRKQ